MADNNQNTCDDQKTYDELLEDGKKTYDELREFFMKAAIFDRCAMILIYNALCYAQDHPEIREDICDDLLDADVDNFDTVLEAIADGLAYT